METVTRRAKIRPFSDIAIPYETKKYFTSCIIVEIIPADVIYESSVKMTKQAND